MAQDQQSVRRSSTLPTRRSRAAAAKTLASLRFAVESLESRRLLASIAGTVFNDLDADGVIDAGESGLSGWTVYHDANLNGVRDSTVQNFASTDTPRSVVDAGTMTSIRNVSGVAGSIVDLNVTMDLSHTWVGDLVVTLVGPAGQRVSLVNQTGGAGNSGENYTNTTFDDEAAQSITTGVPPYTGSWKPLGSLATFDGLSPNGNWTLEVQDVASQDFGTLNSWSLAISTGETAVTSNSTGNYQFSNLAAGTYRIREVIQSPYLQTSPAGGAHDVTVASTDNATGRHFGNRLPPGEIRGTKWNDGDGDGVRDAGEAGLSGVMIYVDADKDGLFDSGEPSAVTGADGVYAIANVAPGSHIVREVVPSGYAQTYPSQFGALSEEPQTAAGPQPVAAATSAQTETTDTTAKKKSTDSAKSRPIRPVWAPGTSKKKVDDFYAKPESLAEGDAGLDSFTFPDSARWSQTATNGSGLTQGHATTLTWRIVADGTPIPGFNGEPAAPSNLQAFLNGIYGSSATWLPLFQQIFASWSQLTGINYVMETADDGSSFSSSLTTSTRGQLGVRADMRIGGHFIDGNSNVLAYNFYPDVGDMVIDTGDNFYANNLANNSRALRNVLAHEHGHGIGLQHVMPTNGTKLMEPFINLGFDGPQHDDVLAANRGYGDRFEKSGGNDTTAGATNFGSLSNGTSSITGVSIDDNSDSDYFRFTAGSAKRATITVAPVGSVYLSGAQNGPAPTSFDSKSQSDLSFQLLAPDGVTVLRTGNLAGIGQNEVVFDVPLNAGGQFYIRVNGSADAAQLYDVSVNIADAFAGAHNVTVAGGQIVSNINFGNRATSGGPTGAISGKTYHDFDNDGNFDAGETPLSGVTVRLDTNNDGSIDQTTVSNASGDYAFTGLADAQHFLTEVPPSGFAVKNTHQVFITAGQTFGGVDFANRPIGDVVFTGTAAADNYLLRRSADAATYEIFIGGVLTHVVPTSGVNSLTFNLGGANDAMTIDYVNGAPMPAGGIRYDGGGLSSEDFDTLTVSGSLNNDAFNLVNGNVTPLAGNIALHPPTGGGSVESVTVNGNAGNDSLFVDQAVFALVTYNGGASTGTGAAGDRLNLNASNGSGAVTIGATNIIAAGNDVTYSGLEDVTVNAMGSTDTITINNTPIGATLTVNGGTENDTFNVIRTSGSPVILNGDTENDTFNFGGATTGNTDNIAAGVTVAGGSGTDVLNYNDQNNAFNGELYQLTGTTIDRTVASPVTFGTLEGLVLNAGPGSSSTTVSGGSSSLPRTINGGAGQDTVDVSNLTGTLTVNGGTETDTVNYSLTNGDDAFAVSGTQVTGGGRTLNYVAENLSVDAMFGFDTITADTGGVGPARVSLRGGDGNDTFTVTPSTVTAFQIDGAAPVVAPGDTLNVSLGGATGATVGDSPEGYDRRVSFADRQPIDYSSIETLSGVDTSAPTANVGDVSPDPRQDAVGEITITFDEAVTGFDLADLALTRNGGGNLLTGGQTLTTTDNVTFTLGNLSGLTGIVGTYLLTLTAAGSGIVDGGGNALAGDASDAWVNNNAAPTVTDVFVAGSAWTSLFKDYLGTSGLGDAAYGYRIPVGTQTNELPWTNLNRISVRFNEAVDVTADDLVIRGVNVATYGATMAYDAATFTATWSLPVGSFFAVDKLLLDLNADAGGVTDASGNALDGEWTNPTAPGETGADTLPSGNGTAGGDFRFRLNVLPGDVNGTGSILGSDVTLVRNAQGSEPGFGLYTIFKDVNGTGSILGSDVTLVRNRQGISLPDSEPVAPASVEDSSTAQATAALTTTTGRTSPFATGSKVRSAMQLLGQQFDVLGEPLEPALVA